MTIRLHLRRLEHGQTTIQTDGQSDKCPDRRSVRQTTSQTEIIKNFQLCEKLLKT